MKAPAAKSSLLCFLFIAGVSFAQQGKTRGLADTVGFAHTESQMQAVMERTGPYKSQDKPLRVAICPHDDYTYVGALYPEVLSGVKAKTVILIGVAHKAKVFGLENRIIFDSFDYWKGPYGKVKISSVRDELMNRLPKNLYQVHDSLQQLEHSTEAIVPFLQYFSKDVQIVSILVPYMSYERMEEIAKPLSEAIHQVAESYSWQWGKDYAIVISTDAVHYGDEDWGGKNYAPFGADSAGYRNAVSFEHQLISECLAGIVNPDKVKKFTGYTVQKDNYKEYKWTWCGRYSVPFGLLTSWHLQQTLKAPALKGMLTGYSNSLDHPHIKVDDIGMGVTAPAKLRHWVGYAGLGYE